MAFSDFAVDAFKEQGRQYSSNSASVDDLSFSCCSIELIPRVVGLSCSHLFADVDLLLLSALKSGHVSFVNYLDRLNDCSVINTKAFTILNITDNADIICPALSLSRHSFNVSSQL